MMRAAMDERTRKGRWFQRRSNSSCLAFVFGILHGMLAGGLSHEAFGQAGNGWSATPMKQENGARMRLPVKPGTVSRYSRLSLSIDTRWSNNYGYRPIEVTISSPTPTVADRLVTVRLHSGWGWGVEAEQSFEMPLGSTSVTTIVAVPQYQSANQYYSWDVWIDGRKDKDLSLDIADLFRVFGGNTGSTAGKSFLVVAPTAAATGPNALSNNSQRTLVAPNDYEFDVLTLRMNEFPRRWIDYTCLDVVALSWNELLQLSKVNPDSLAAIQRWLHSGGQLWVDQVGQELEALEELSALLQLQTTESDSSPRDSDSDEQSDPVIDLPGGEWGPVRFRRGMRDGQVVTFLNITTGQSHVVRESTAIQQMQNDPNFVVTDQQFDTAEEEVESERRWPRESTKWFVEHRIGFGTVRAFRESSEIAAFSRRPNPANANMAASVDPTNKPPALETSIRTTDKWNARHGVAPDDACFDFSNLLVPGVGLAPVTEFSILITVFVLLIGPLNYWLLKRMHRMHLLVLTVPLAAGLMTAALFAYATISDGFSTAVRVRSVTTLDQRTGQAACWARISYYSGLAPRDGLIMPADLVLYPIHPAWNSSSIDASFGAERELIWSDGEARLKRGWLRSRTPTQYLTIRSRTTPHRLDLAQGGGKLRAKNQLGTEVEVVLVTDRGGELWIGRNLAAGTVAFLKKIERRDALRLFRDLVMQSDPQPPAALSGSDSHFAVMQRRQMRQMYGRFGLQSGDSRLATNLMNDMVGELAGLTGGPALALPPQSYVAITESGPEVELGLAGAVEQESFHLIVGQW